MRWYLIYTKPRSEERALENLERQGYECYLPLYLTEKLRRGELTVADTPLFPRYLFIRLGQDYSSKSWSPIRSTRGVSRLVRFGQHLAQADDALIALLKSHEQQSEPERMFNQGDSVRIMDGPFAGIEAVYQMPDGERRALVLIEMLSKPTSLRVDLTCLRKEGLSRLRY
jgi:transcriptional antiterminator RfaH